MCAQDDAHFAPRVTGGANTTLPGPLPPAPNDQTLFN